MTILPKKKVPKDRQESAGRGPPPSSNSGQSSLRYSPEPSTSSGIRDSGRSKLPPNCQLAYGRKKPKLIDDGNREEHNLSSCLSVPERAESRNSDDERNADGEGGNPQDLLEREVRFANLLKEKRGFVIKPMGEDGACLFRAVADQVFGDQEMHDVVRRQCLDYMERNQDYFGQYITEDFRGYIERKRLATAHGNHVEIQAMSEVYNRRIEVYQYDIDPMNVFQGAHPQENAPIRVSYHQKCHYNSVVDPYAATIGVGLGLPGLQPGMAEKSLVSQAVGESEKDYIEKQMLEDKMLATDWEATAEAIERQIAQESYLEWLKQQDKTEEQNAQKPEERPSTSKDKPRSPPLQTQEALSSAPPAAVTVEKQATNQTTSDDGSGNYELVNQLQHLPPTLFGLNDFEMDEDELLAQVLAASQAEYMDSFKRKEGESR